MTWPVSFTRTLGSCTENDSRRDEQEYPFNRVASLNIKGGTSKPWLCRSLPHTPHIPQTQTCSAPKGGEVAPRMLLDNAASKPSSSPCSPRHSLNGPCYCLHIKLLQLQLAARFVMSDTSQTQMDVDRDVDNHSGDQATSKAA